MGRGVPQAGLLLDPPPGADGLRLPVDLVLERALQEPERVEVLHLDLHPEGRLSDRSDGDVRVAAQAALLHVAVVDPDGGEDAPQPGEEDRGRGRRPQIRMRHDLDQRHAAAVEVEVGLPVGVAAGRVQRLARVLLEMHPDDAHDAFAVVLRVSHLAVGGQGMLVLRDLIALGQVGIEVVLAGEDRARLHGAAQGQGRAHAQLDGTAVQHRQRPGQSEAHRTHVGVRRRPETGGATAEDLRVGEELRVDLEPDHRLEEGVAHYRASSWRPTGTPLAGPAAATSDETSPANRWKFSANMPASRPACAS